MTVDFAQSRHTAGSMLGFLRGVDETIPEGQWITPLHPAFWRGDFAVTPYQRVASFGARYEVVLSDYWPWSLRGPPYDDLSGWYAAVRNVALANQHPGIVWDIWNEPDTPWFWNGSLAQFEETFSTAEAAVRSVVGPGAQFAGPSLAWFDWPVLKGLLEYCAANNCQVDFLSWHETAAVQNIAAHVLQARQRLLADPALASTRVRFILIDEALGGGDRLDPGKLVAYLDQLERGGANGGVLSCWREPTGESNCPEHTLDGLLDPATGQPRGVWWAAKAYAEGVGSQVQTHSFNPALAAIASARAPDTKHAEVLLGYFDPGTPQPPTTPVTVLLLHLRALPFLRTSRAVRISVVRMPSGGSPATPQTIGDPRTVVIGSGVVTVTLPNVALQDAVSLRLTSAS